MEQVGEGGGAEVDQGDSRRAQEVDEHVVGVDVAVQHAAAVQAGEHARELAADLDNLAVVEPDLVAGQAEAGRGYARGAGHGDVGLLGLGGVVEEARQAGDVEQGQQLGLAFEAEDVVRVRRAQELEREVVAAAAVVGEVHLPLGAGAEHADELVAAVEARGGAPLGVGVADRREGAAQLGGALGAVAGLEREGGGEDQAEVGRRVAAVVDLVQRAQWLDPRELAGEQLVEGDAEAEHVEALVGGGEAGLEREVAGRADRQAHRGAAARLGDEAGGVAVALGDAGEAEVDQLDAHGVTVLGEHDVAGLDVAMDEALAVDRVEGVGDLDPDLDDLPPRQRARGDQALAEVRAGEQLEGHVQVPAPAVVGLVIAAVGEHPHDRRVLHVGQHLGLADEAALQLVVVAAQQLDRHDRAQLLVAGAGHHRLAAGADRLEQDEAVAEAGARGDPAVGARRRAQGRRRRSARGRRSRG